MRLQETVIVLNFLEVVFNIPTDTIFAPKNRGIESLGDRIAKLHEVGVRLKNG